MPTTISTTPWSKFTEADYTLEQWIRACLIHPQKPSTNKGDYKLPVREPDGTLNKNAIHAVAGVLAGARGGVKASPSQTKAAAQEVIRLYGLMNSDPPSHVKAMAHSDLSHFGVRGMHWGVRRSRLPSSSDAARVNSSKKIAKKSGTDALSTKDLQELVTRMNLEQQYSRMTAKPGPIKRGLSFTNGVLSAGNTVNQAIQFSNSPSGKFLRSQIEEKMKSRASG